MQNLDDRLESEYYKYLKFQVDETSKRYAYYLTFFKDASSILDLGCGHGHFLELVRNEGKEGLGVDRDEGMIQICQQKSLTVVREDIFTFLSNTDRKFDAIFSSHLIEHLSAERTIEFLNLCNNILKDEGVIVLIAPNPRSLHVHLNQFWVDPTHVRLYDQQLIEFLLHFSGYEVLECKESPKSVYSPTFLRGLDDLVNYSFKSQNLFIDLLKKIKRSLVKFLIKRLLNHPMERLISQLEYLNNLNKYLNVGVSEEIYVVGRKRHRDV